MKNKLFLMAFLVLVFSSVLVTANPSFNWINLTYPTNQTYNVNGTVFFKYNLSGTDGVNSSNLNICTLYHNASGNWAAISTDQNVSNATDSNFTVTGLSDTVVGWTVGCTTSRNSTLVFARDHAGNNVSNSSNDIHSFTVDKTAPAITVNSPSTWQRNGTGVQFNVTPQDLYADSCVLETSLNESSNSSRGGSSFNFTAETVTFTNGTPINFSFGWNKLVGAQDPSVLWRENNTGAYLWNVACNDSAGNVGRISGGNRTLFVDTVIPNGPFLKSPFNFTLSTDLTPTLVWDNATDLNFSLYEVQLANGSAFTASDIIWQVNITTNNSDNETVVRTEGTFIGNISYDQTYFWRVRAYDMAGNINSTNQIFTYRTDSTCGILVPGVWNICSYTMNVSINASSLCDQVSCSFISLYNNTNQFQTYTSGSSTNGAMPFIGSGNNSRNQVVFIYLRSSTNVTWENRTDDIKLNLFNYTLRNDSTGWNIIPSFYQNLSSVKTNFQNLHESLNANGSIANFSQLAGGHNVTVNFLSKYYAENASTSRFTSYAANRSFNNFTRIEYGELLWAHLNKSIPTFYWNSSNEIGNGTNDDV